jgi:hypothetical protein
MSKANAKLFYGIMKGYFANRLIINGLYFYFEI